MLRHILIRPTGQTQGGDLMACTASDMADLYAPDELARLAIGLSVERGGQVHTDLLAFHNRHATPDLKGSTLLRRLLGWAVFAGHARAGVAA